MRDFVEVNLVESAHRQKINYNKHSSVRHFTVGDHVWLSFLTARKFDPHWDGKWTITAVEGLLIMEISDGTTSKVAHVNRLRHRLQPSPNDSLMLNNDQPRIWSPPHIFVNNRAPDVEHNMDSTSELTSRKYPVRTRRPPLRYIEESS